MDNIETDNLDSDNDSDTLEENLDERPGGSDGQDVRARKEYDRRRQVEQERDDALANNAAMEQRLQALELERTPVATQPVKMNEAQIHEEYSAGRMDATTAERELERARLDDRNDYTNEILNKVDQRQQTREEVEKANSEVEEFIKIFPDLRKQDSPLFKQVKTEYARLRRLNSPDNPLTEHLAVKQVLGSLDRAKESNSRTVDDYDRENRDTSTVTGSSRPSDGGGNNKALRNVDRQTRDWWDEQGYDQERQERLAKRYTAPLRLRRNG